ncbi:SPRY domain-containing protein [Phlyctema vagabunda]|uniref:SPRY domain-containing protein n=1 Tax=Phlyctema vagabunda TaxID=108571 RepID=A0ABR4PP85_9HELO
MCFGKSLKGDDPSSRLNNDYNEAPRPVDSKAQRNSSVKMPQNDSYSPPAGPPPGHQSNSYAPPAGPPPGHSDSYAAPPGPPPGHAESYTAPPGPPPNFHNNDYAAPPGPPPSKKDEPYHDWQTAVPDTSLLPPPPSLGNQHSRTNNASEQEAEQGEMWCQQNPLLGPATLQYDAVQAMQAGNIGIMKPRSMKGDVDRARAGVWSGKTKANSPDSCIISTLPLYAVQEHSPLQTRNSKTIYYEVKISKHNRKEVSLALGYTAPPYPTFRLPGWHRGSLAIHGDDGSKYINDRWGGKDFTTPFKPGQTLGIGMVFTARNINAPPAYCDGPMQAQTTATTPINVEIFFTKDGKRDGGWNLHEEGDAVEDLPVHGLEGLNDLYAAVGTFEAVDFEIVFSEREWLYHP